MAVARALKLLHLLEDWLLALLALALVLIAGAQIAARFLPGGGLPWADSVSKTLVLWLVMLGALAATRFQQHLGMDALQHILPVNARAIVRALCALAACVFCVVATFYAVELVQLERSSPSDPNAIIPSWITLAIIPLGFAAMSLRFGAQVYSSWTQRNVATAVQDSTT